MQLTDQLLGGNGYWIISLAVFLDVLGCPGTAIPFLAIAGALATTGKISLALVVLLATFAAALGDVLWYLLGRAQGQRLLTALTKLTGCSHKNLERYTRMAAQYSVAFLLISKFVPGVATIAPPAAGIVSMPLTKFLVVDTVGRILWVTSVSWLGYFCFTSL
jgi:membrane protein DedA with SNARE-associated domain